MEDYDSAQQANIAAFGRMLDSLLATDLGKFVVIRNAELVGSFATLEAALRFGYGSYGRRAFLVQQVAPMPTGVDDFHLACPA